MSVELCESTVRARTAHTCTSCGRADRCHSLQSVARYRVGSLCRCAHISCTAETAATAAVAKHAQCLHACGHCSTQQRNTLSAAQPHTLDESSARQLHSCVLQPSERRLAKAVFRIKAAAVTQGSRALLHTLSAHAESAGSPRLAPLGLHRSHHKASTAPLQLCCQWLAAMRSGKFLKVLD
jgi:hypothetical protein